MQAVHHVGEGGLSSKGVAFMTALAVLTTLAVLESTLSSFCFSYKNAGQRGNRGGFGGSGGFDHDGYPP